MATAIYCGRTCKSRAVEARRDRDDAARYIAERERRIEYAIAYAKANPHIGQAAKRRHRTARGVGFKFTGSDWLRTQRRFNNSCAYCGKTGPLTMDHVVPIIRGGTHGEGNIVPACRSCNCRKQGRFITEWKYGKSRKAQATT
jgi:5-methylcytosine-specific restriction endonuclease McrA